MIAADETEQLDAQEAVQLTPCGGTSLSEKLCCGNTADCCDVVNADQAVVIPRSLSASGAASTMSSTFSSSVSTSTTEPTRSSTAERGRKIAIGVGLGLGVLTLILCTFLGLHFMKHRRAQQATPADQQDKNARKEELAATTRQELETKSRAELYESRAEVENP
jgi:hypothetical protein